MGAHVTALDGAPQPVVDRRVDQLRVAEAIAEARAGQQVGRAVHRLDPAGDRDLGVTGADLRRGQHDRLQAGAADPVDGRRRRCFGETGLEHGLASGGLAGPGLEDLAHQHVVDLGGGRIEARAFHRGPDSDGTELGGGNCSKRSAELPDRGSRSADEEDGAVRSMVLGHRRILVLDQFGGVREVLLESGAVLVRQIDNLGRGERSSADAMSSTLTASFERYRCALTRSTGSAAAPKRARPLSSVFKACASSPWASPRRAATRRIWARPSVFSGESASSVSPSSYPQPVPARVDDAEAADGPVSLPRSCDLRDAGHRQLAVCLPQPRGEVAVEGVGVRDDDDRGAVRVRRIEPVHAEEVDVDVLAGDDCVWVRPDLAIGTLETDRL